MKTLRLVSELSDGCVYQDPENLMFFFEDVDGKSAMFESENRATEEFYIKQALDYLGSAIRDNSREEKISIGKQIVSGTFED